MSGFIKKRGFLVVRSLLLLTLLFAVGAFVMTAFRPARASLTPTTALASMSSVDILKVTSLTCALSSGAQNSNVYNYYVTDGGGNCTMTLSGDAGCDTITVWIQSSNFGNITFNATRADASSPYVGSFTLPDNVCHTAPVSYLCGANQVGNGHTFIDAEGPGGEDNVHLSAVKTDGTADTDCQGQQYVWVCRQNDCIEVPLSEVQDGETAHETLTECEASGCSGVDDGCALSEPPLTDLGCNPSPTQYAPDANRITKSTTGDCEISDITVIAGTKTATTGCGYTITHHYTAYCVNNPTITCEAFETFTWTEDTEAPVFNNLPSGDDLELGCNPPELPSCKTVTATDNCDGQITASCTPGEIVEDGCNRSQSFTYKADAACGPDAEQTVTYTWKESVVSVECPTNLVPLQAGEGCTAVLAGDIRASGSGCGVSEIEYSVNGQVIDIDTYEFPVGVTTVSASVTGPCGSDSCTFDVDVRGKICVHKFYDANNNGIDDDNQNVTGVTITVTGTGFEPVSGTTDANGNVCFLLIPAGDYTVTETVPAGYTATTPTSVSVSVSAEDCDPSATFGNNCQCTPGGHTMGFWSNPNGQALLTAADFTMLNAVALRNANGTDRDFLATKLADNKKAYKDWLLAANSVNAAYMLSAQLSALKLSVKYGFTSNTGCIVGVVNGGEVTVTQLIAYAELLLAADGYTPAGDPNRAEQIRIQEIINLINNGKTFVKPTPCEFGGGAEPQEAEGFLTRTLSRLSEV